MNVARIENGVVANIEVAEQDWIDECAANGITLVPYGDQPIQAGMSWSEADGFGPPPLTPPSEESIAWAAANGDTSWADALAAQANQ